MDPTNLLVCDLESTLLGDDLALNVFARWHAQANCPFRLVYVSEQFVETILASIRTSSLPKPGAIIGGIGTEIYDVTASRRVPMWPPSPLGWNPHVIQAICESHKNLTLRPKQFLSYHKVSYFAANLTQTLIDDLRRRMTSAGLQVTIACSSERHLDIVPMGVNKGAATAHLAYRWKIEPKRVIVAGGSDDNAPMFQAGFRGIVVGNAHPELCALVGPNIYQATEVFAAGVLEGIEHWLEAPPFSSVM